MKADGIRNYQQSPNFGAIEIPRTIYDKNKLAIEMILSKELGDIHGFYLGKTEQLGMDTFNNIAYYLKNTRNRTVKENNLIEILKQFSISNELKIKPVSANDVKAAKNRFGKFIGNPNSVLLDLTDRILSSKPV